MDFNGFRQVSIEILMIFRGPWRPGGLRAAIGEGQQVHGTITMSGILCAQRPQGCVDERRCLASQDLEAGIYWGGFLMGLGRPRWTSSSRWRTKTWSR